MPLQAAKAIFTVTAGVIPGSPMPEFTKQWGYTSGDYQTDVESLSQEPVGRSLFLERLDAAHAYGRSLTDPRAVNWVRIEFMWM